ncbi:MAG: hypothetical protein A2W00_12800 [Candidatus Eisenbacteria bacterium RBG_16_71_46]|nr:MAG: hypothetical protein A2W00_12800 [Candidatus Eisenbacteria bacterium RBG_16_71_46]OGF23106.1 MAG: hypothetical protein A2V63_04020 [Candidatus Eisenbacteria bacterium RBG_19FT_COMBO_70_11]
MRRSYLALFAVIVLIAVGVTLAGRAPRDVPPPAKAQAAVPVVRLAIEVRAGAVLPPRAAVPKDHRVELEVRNGEARTVRLALAGYDDRVSLSLAPGERWAGSFLADRPGDDFAWLLDGRAAGRLDVTGSHLEEGHR